MLSELRQKQQLAREAHGLRSGHYRENDEHFEHFREDFGKISSI